MHQINLMIGPGCHSGNAGRAQPDGIISICGVRDEWRSHSNESMRAQIGMLIVATSIIQLANGFFNTFISLRLAIGDFGAELDGLVLSSYFAGFTLGALRCGRIIERSRTHPCLCRLSWPGRRSNRGYADPDRTVVLDVSACDRRYRRRRSLCHDRELAQRQGPAIGAG